MNALNIGIFICSFKNIIEAVMKIWKPKTKLKLTNYSSSYKSLFRHYQNDNALPAIMSVVFFLYSVNLTECVAIDTRVSVGVSVCVSVYVSVSSLQPKRMDGFWWNCPQITYYEFARSVLSHALLQGGSDSITTNVCLSVCLSVCVSVCGSASNFFRL